MAPESTYGYFTEISLICNIVNELINKTGSSLQYLLENSVSFKKWYREYAPLAIVLYDDMLSKCSNSLRESIAVNAKMMLNVINDDIEALKKQLSIYRDMEKNNPIASTLCRMTVAIIYKRVGYSWSKLKREDLDYIEREMYKNLLSGEFQDGDVTCWLNAYRGTDQFDAMKAIRVIEDFMVEGYQKEYAKWILSFEAFQQSLVSEEEVKDRLDDCKKASERLLGQIQSSRALDAYTIKTNECPIVQIRDIAKTKMGDYKGLKKFRGIIRDIRGTTSGRIALDGTQGMSVYFNPRGKHGSKNLEIKDGDITRPVSFYLLFSYSGLRAWQPEILNR